MPTKDEKTDFDNKVFKFLDDLQDCGLPNMFGAVPFLLEMFPHLDESRAKNYLSEWMRTFHKRHPDKNMN